jgi:hypothetical protein
VSPQVASALHPSDHGAVVGRGLSPPWEGCKVVSQTGQREREMDRKASSPGRHPAAHTHLVATLSRTCIQRLRVEASTQGGEAGHAEAVGTVPGEESKSTGCHAKRQIEK